MLNDYQRACIERLGDAFDECAHAFSPTAYRTTTGTTAGTPQLLHADDGTSGQIPAIKAIREATGMSLKDAKNLAETIGRSAIAMQELDEAVNTILAMPHGVQKMAMRRLGGV